MPEKVRSSRKSLRRTNNPKLFQRGVSKLYYFRRRVDGKDKWINTQTSDLVEAKRLAKAYVEAEANAEGITRASEPDIKSLADNISRSIVEEVTGKKVYSLKLSEAFDKWTALAPEYSDISKRSKDFCKTSFQRFQTWCQARDIEYCEGISNEVAISYANNLWERGITTKTFNEHIRMLSRLFIRLESAGVFNRGNPFSKEIVQRKGNKKHNTVGHEAIEKPQVELLITRAAAYGPDYRDLFIIGSQTGMRLKDAALLRWDQIDGDFIQITPHKTKRSGSKARIPITETISGILAARLKSKTTDFVLAELADDYIRSPESVTCKTKRIFENVFGKFNTYAASGIHRKNKTCIYSFHSFRTTYMSLLARQDVSIRDAMRIMGWESVEMIRIYERELEKNRKNADERTLKMVRRIEEFGITVPDCNMEEQLVPTKEALLSLKDKYSNIAIGQIYGISEAAVRKWLRKFAVIRKARIASPSLTDDKISAVRKTLKDMA